MLLLGKFCFNHHFFIFLKAFKLNQFFFLSFLILDMKVSLLEDKQVLTLPAKNSELGTLPSVTTTVTTA